MVLDPVSADVPVSLVNRVAAGIQSNKAHVPLAPAHGVNGLSLLCARQSSQVVEPDQQLTQELAMVAPARVLEPARNVKCVN